MRFLISPNNQVETRFAVTSHNRERFKHPNTNNSVCQLFLSSLFPFHNCQPSFTEILFESEERAIAILRPHAIIESSSGLVGCVFAPLWFCGDSEERYPLKSEQSKLPQRANPGFDPTASAKEPDSFLWEMLSPTLYLPLSPALLPSHIIPAFQPYPLPPKFSQTSILLFLDPSPFKALSMHLCQASVFFISHSPFK